LPHHDFICDDRDNPTPTPTHLVQNCRHHWPLHENPKKHLLVSGRLLTPNNYSPFQWVSNGQQLPVHRCFAMLGASLACDGSAAPHVEGSQPCDRRHGLWMGMGYSLPSLPYLGLGDLGIPGSVWNLAIAPNYDQSQWTKKTTYWFVPPPNHPCMGKKHTGIRLG
jgi:hypothetical protein